MANKPEASVEIVFWTTIFGFFAWVMAIGLPSQIIKDIWWKQLIGWPLWLGITLLAILCTTVLCFYLYDLARSLIGCFNRSSK